jgi:hypothetical protein
MRFYDLAYHAINAIYTVHKPIEILYVRDDRDGQTRKASDQPCIRLKKEFKNSLVDFEFLNILRSDTSPLKSAIVNGDVFSVTIHGIFALLAAFTPSGAFSTTNASEGSKFNFLDADSNGEGSDLPFPSNESSSIITLNLYFPKTCSMIIPISSLAAPLTTAFGQSFKSLIINSLTPSYGLV